MNTVFLITGGNLGNREQNLEMARDMIGKSCGKIMEMSALYETAAWGKTDQPSFLNQVLKINTPLAAAELLEQVLNIEKQAGRKRNEKYGPRTIDIDILFFNKEVITGSSLVIPHPQLQNRRFVLVPLAEIAPGFKHPVLQKTIAELLAVCPDRLEVKPFWPGEPIP